MAPSRQLLSRFPKTTLNGPNPSTMPSILKASRHAAKTQTLKIVNIICTGLLFGAVFLCVQGRLHAQSAKSDRTNTALLGPVFITSLMTQTSDAESAKNAGYRVGFGGGLHLRVYPDKAVALQFGATFLQRGATGTNDTDSTDPFVKANADLVLNYVSFDALANWLVVRNDAAAFRLFGGPYMDLFVSGEGRANFSSVLGSVTFLDTLTTADITSPSFGIAFGAGVDLEAAGGVFAFDLRYDLGLSRLQSDPDVADYWYSRGIQFQLSYLFRL